MPCNLSNCPFAANSEIASQKSRPGASRLDMRINSSSNCRISRAMDSHADEVHRFPKSRCRQARRSAQTSSERFFLSLSGNATNVHPLPEFLSVPRLRISLLSLLLWITGAHEDQCSCGREPPFHICTVALHMPFNAACGTRVKVRPQLPHTRRLFQFRRIAQPRFRKLVTSASPAHTGTLRAFHFSSLNDGYYCFCI